MHYASLTRTSFFFPFLVLSRTLAFEAKGLGSLSLDCLLDISPLLTFQSTDLFRNVLACRSTCTKCDRSSPRRRSPTAWPSFDRLSSSPLASALHILTLMVSSDLSSSSSSSSSSSDLAWWWLHVRVYGGEETENEALCTAKQRVTCTSIELAPLRAKATQHTDRRHERLRMFMAYYPAISWVPTLISSKLIASVITIMSFASIVCIAIFVRSRSIPTLRSFRRPKPRICTSHSSKVKGIGVVGFVTT